MASNNIARLGVVLGLDTAEFTASIDKAINENRKLGQAIKRDTNAAAGEIIALKYATDDYGKTLTKVQIIEREINDGRFKLASADIKAQLLAQAAAYDAVAITSKKAATGLTQFEKQNLMYQTTDFVTQVASGQNAMIAFMQQGGQLKDVMGGVKETFAKLAPIVFSVTGAFVVGTAAVGGLAYAMYAGRKEFDEFNKSIILTGNYSKVTYDEFGKMASAISGSTRASISDAKDILNAMIGSGQFTNQTFDSVSKTIEKFRELTGLSAKDAAAKLIPSLDGSASSAKRLNDQYNFLTLTQYKHIEALERQGKTQEAIIYTSDLLKESFSKTKTELGYIDTALDYTTKKWSEFWNAAMNLGKPDTPQDKLKKVQDELENVRKSKFVSAGLGSNISGQEKFDAKKSARIQELEAEKEALQENIRLAAKKNDLTGQKEAIDERSKAGGLSAELSLVQQYEKAKRDLKYSNLMDIADEETKIIYESAHKQEDLYAQYLADTSGKDRVFAGIRTKTYIAEMQKEMVDREQRMDDYRQKELNKTVDAAQAERFARQKIDDEENNKRLEKLGEYTNKYYAASDASKNEKDKLEAQIQMVGMSEKQVKLAELEARYQEDIARNILESKGDKSVLEQWNKLAEAKKNDAKLNIELTDQLSYMKEINDTVWKDMTSALDEFVNTGSLNFSKLTQSIIQDLLKIQLKKQALALWETASGGGGFTGLLAAGAKFFGFADGGDPPVGVPSMVGERGPELFIPKTAGTIISNNMLKGNDSGPTINYNGPYIANMSAIDTQSGVAFLAKNKQAVWATYQSANRSIPMSR
jgi:phage-related minor tail protein